MQISEALAKMRAMQQTGLFFIPARYGNEL